MNRVNRVSRTALFAVLCLAVVVCSACGVDSPIAASTVPTSASGSGVLTATTARAASADHSDPWYLLEPAPCAFTVKHDYAAGVDWVDLVAFQSANQADVYSGVFAVDSTTLLQSWHNGIQNKTAQGWYQLKVQWNAAAVHPAWVAAGGFVSGVLYRSDNCALLY